ncbi:MAG: hypothetical protein COV72_04505 [Candidatus Omnitrophica bacterium CG11_big_fil_rev_8_21_14_0_20_42_13]|uniref:Autotransporter domain-containing protein n=1 Tax=Candidatus Ghiorseimicrobium undicola TaxID=1974746 RepID=A0A2H0LXQ7_9BACT|nr:MAG: hypothetical protein COV72_04505 [Candidatus Omnitrophica bacterium CG11_big_fil_rev_8_21_14_0_20_42_13]
MANMYYKKIIKRSLLSFLLLAFFLTDASYLFSADEDENRSEQQEDKVASFKKSILSEAQTTSELIELLKQRALLRVKKKKREQLLKFSVFASLAGGYENNVNNDSSTKGDIFTSQFAMVGWNPIFNKHLGLNVNTLAFNQIYSDFTDSNYLYAITNAGLRLYPFSDGRLRLEPGIGYESLWYPDSPLSSYSGMKYFLKTKNYLSRNFNIDLNFEFSTKEYNTKKARNPSGVEMDFVREDERYAFEAGITQRIGRYSITIEEEAYRNTSNDLLQDLNDYYALKSSLNISGTFLEDRSLYVSFTPSFERKNYRVRLGRDNARFDDRYNYKLAVYYTLNKNISVSYRFDYWKLDSNNIAAEYENVINQVGLSVRF